MLHFYISALLLHTAVYQPASADGYKEPFGCDPSLPFTDAIRSEVMYQTLGSRDDLVKGFNLDVQQKVPDTPENMYMLMWDCSMEEEAQKIADQCPTSTPAAPNNYALNYDRIGLPDRPAQYSVSDWRAQIDNVVFENPYNGDPGYRELANMLQASITRYACASKDCPVNDTVNICLYNAPNIQTGQMIYTPGTPCAVDADCTTFTPASCDDSLCYLVIPTTTPAPTSTSTPAPTSTSTAAPTSTSTPAPTSTSTPAPTSTSTPAPTSTSTPAPTSTSTPAPTSTSTPAPAAPVSTTSPPVTANANPKPELNQWCPANCCMLDRVREKALNMHNYRRSQLAKGLVAKNNGNLLPQAANMLQLRYDCELEKAAQAHADKCIAADSDPNTRQGIEENVHSVYISQSTPYKINAMEESVKVWWKQVRLVEGIGMKVTFKAHHLQSTIRWFTKMAWATTEWLGCAVAKCDAQGIFVVVCRYKPGGNIVNHVVYEVGERCNCPTGYSCSTGEKLCILSP